MTGICVSGSFARLNPNLGGHDCVCETQPELPCGTLAGIGADPSFQVTFDGRGSVKQSFSDMPCQNLPGMLVGIFFDAERLFLWKGKGVS